MKIKKGDTVKLMGGKDRGKTGTVLRVFPALGKLTVEGRNIGKKHRKPRAANQKGQIVEFPRALPISRVMLICPKCGATTRVGYERSSEGHKSRRCRRCQATFA